MLPMKKEKEFTISVTVGAIVNLILNLLVINKLQSLGTTMASVAAEFIVTGIQVYFLRDFIDLKEILKTIVKPLISSIVMFIIIIFIIPIFDVGVIWTMVEVAIGGLIYMLSMYLLKDQFLNEAINLMKNKILKR